MKKGKRITIITLLAAVAMLALSSCYTHKKVISYDAFLRQESQFIDSMSAQGYTLSDSVMNQGSHIFIFRNNKDERLRFQHNFMVQTSVDSIKYVDRKSIRSYGCVASNPTLCDSLNVQDPKLEADTTIKAYRTWPIVVGIVAAKAFEWAAVIGIYKLFE